MATCRAWEIQNVNPANHNDKFYRIFVVGSQWMAQYGANGTVGQFLVRGSTSPATAMDDALKVSDKKMSEGYYPVVDELTFEVPDAYLTALKGHGQYCDAQFRAASKQRPTSPTTRATGGSSEDRRKAKEKADIEEFKQTLLRMRDKARTPIAGRNPEVPEQLSGEIESPPVEISTKSPIELALAKAIAAKKENA